MFLKFNNQLINLSLVRDIEYYDNEISFFFDMEYSEQIENINKETYKKLCDILERNNLLWKIEL